MADATADDLGALFGLSTRMIRELSRTGVLVKTGRGLFDRDASTTRYIARLREEAAGRRGEGGLDAVAEGAKLKEAQRLRIEMDMAEKRGDLVSLETLTPAWSRTMVAIRGAVLAIPGKARTKLPHLTAHDGEELEGICRDALEQASDELDGFADVEEGA